MPDLGIGELLSIIIPAAVGTAGLGAQLAGVGQPSQGAALKQEQELQREQAAAQQKQQEQSLKQAELKASPDAQEATSGFLSPASFANFVNQLTGNQGTIGSAANTLGLNISGGTEGTPSNSPGRGISDVLKNLFPQGSESAGLDSSTLTSPHG